MTAGDRLPLRPLKRLPTSRTRDRERFRIEMDVVCATFGSAHLSCVLQVSCTGAGGQLLAGRSRASAPDHPEWPRPRRERSGLASTSAASAPPAQSCGERSRPRRRRDGVGRRRGARARSVRAELAEKFQIVEAVFDPRKSALEDPTIATTDKATQKSLAGIGFSSSNERGGVDVMPERLGRAALNRSAPNAEKGQVLRSGFPYHSS